MPHVSIHFAGCLIQNDELWISNQSSDEGNAVPQSTGQSDTTSFHGCTAKTQSLKHCTHNFSCVLSRSQPGDEMFDSNLRSCMHRSHLKDTKETGFVCLYLCRIGPSVQRKTHRPWPSSQHLSPSYRCSPSVRTQCCTSVNQKKAPDPATPRPAYRK